MPTIVLENVRSAWNVGSIFRTCDALGFDIILTGYTPRPIGSTLDLIKKTSIGAEKTVRWLHFDTPNEVFASTPEKTHYAIDILPNQSVDIFDYLKNNELNEDIFLWFGNELSGVSQDVQSNCVAVLHLPMQGIKESLNIANSVTATGYILLASKRFLPAH